MNPREAAEVCAMIDAAWPRHPMTRDTRNLLAKLVEPLHADSVRKGLTRLVLTHTFPPSIAEIIRASLPPEEKKGGYEAWGEVSLEVRRIGRNGTPSFNDPVLSRAVELFGWLAICDSRNEEADRVHFARLYDSLRERGETTGPERQLTGGPGIGALAGMVGRSLPESR